MQKGIRAECTTIALRVKFVHFLQSMPKKCDFGVAFNVIIGILNVTSFAYLFKTVTSRT